MFVIKKKQKQNNTCINMLVGELVRMIGLASEPFASQLNKPLGDSQLAHR